MADYLGGGDVNRRAGWLPQEQDDLESWLAGHRDRVEARGGNVALHPVIIEFQILIDSDPVVRMYMNEMIAQVPVSKPYTKRHLESVEQLLRLINEVLTMAPEFSEGSMVTTPLAGILDWTMGTPAGFAAYRDPRINAMLGKILTAWGEFLSGPDSLYVLNDSPAGWKSERAQEVVGMNQYEHRPEEEFWGFASWNDFFTRRFKAGQRPVASPDDDKVIVSACESTPYGISTNVQRRSRFWIKSQPYSLEDMLANDESVEKFVGGTVYQAFLSALNYHRWHSPVAGTIVRAFVQPGTYFSEADSEGADAVEPKNSQAYLAHVAARAIILIQADDPVIGLMAVVPVGMVEVSSCVIDPKLTAGHHVDKGEELGYFQFGGSTECLVFRPGAIEGFSLTALPQPHDPAAGPVLVRSQLATARMAATPLALH
ncbi:phosphatidylserine decarboxylase family protein [Cryobacterium algoricola]|uniref:Phosphatidylserine decarboxylase family protein n=2 Tax=Cryobacterium algoricola TaxID=1259183 RepID=A0ABY2IEZ3_9MICO|nr:phosphatidylserine decarboxylase family protein [Cryobacterium algoricola]